MSNVAIGAIPYQLVAPLRLKAKRRRKEDIHGHRPNLKSIGRNKHGKCRDLHSFGKWKCPVKPSHIEGAEGDCRHEQSARNRPNCWVDSLCAWLASFLRQVRIDRQDADKVHSRKGHEIYPQQSAGACSPAQRKEIPARRAFAKSQRTKRTRRVMASSSMQVVVQFPAVAPRALELAGVGC